MEDLPLHVVVFLSYPRCVPRMFLPYDTRTFISMFFIFCAVRVLPVSRFLVRSRPRIAGSFLYTRAQARTCVSYDTCILAETSSTANKCNAVIQVFIGGFVRSLVGQRDSYYSGPHLAGEYVRYMERSSFLILKESAVVVCRDRYHAGGWGHASKRGCNGRSECAQGGLSKRGRERVGKKFRRFVWALPIARER